MRKLVCYALVFSLMLVYFDTVIWPLLIITLMGLLFAPLFLCVDIDPPFTLLGHVIGLVYSVLW